MKTRGFSLIEVVVAIILIFGVVFVVLRQLGPRGRGGSGGGVWMQTENGWEAKGKVPQCPDPLLQFPVDLNLATSILYPGQYRGGDYKPHGGFRFDNQKTNEIKVAAPMDATVVRGARYPVDGETQYTFDFINDCGYMYRFGHLLTLSPKLAAIAEQFPMNGEGDSRDTAVEPPVTVKAGEIIATAVGLTKGNHDGGINVFVDWGVYDLRVKNRASANAEWATKHPHQIEQHAVCWFDLLQPKERTIVLGLPSSDSQSGQTSDYCTK